MKNKMTIILCLLFLFETTSFGQNLNEINDKKVKYGFGVGVNYTNLILQDNTSSNVKVQNGAGFTLGLVGEFTVAKSFFIVPKTAVSIYSGKVLYNLDMAESRTYNVISNSADFALHFEFKKDKEGAVPYFFAGPSIKLPLNKKSTDQSTFPSSWNAGVDFGIGLEKPMKRYRIRPELSYSYGMRNVNHNPVLKGVFFHSVSFVLYFT